MGRQLVVETLVDIELAKRLKSLLQTGGSLMRQGSSVLQIALA
jgi:hypothetical protein